MALLPNPAESLLFEEICKVLELLEYKKKQELQKKEKQKILAKFFEDFRTKCVREGKKISSLFPIVRLLLPKLERERCAYNMKERKLGELLVKVLSLNKESEDAKMLLKLGTDLPRAAYFIFNKRLGRKSGEFTILDVNNILDKIATAEVGNKGLVLHEAFMSLIKNLTATQMKWILRIILKDMKLAMGETAIFDAFHPDAPELYKKRSNLAKVCEELIDNTRPTELGIEIFSAVGPMLSEKLDVTDTTKLSTSKMYQIEIKFDGERFQIHMENGVFEYFSRNGFSYTNKYGRTFDSGLVTPFLKDSFSPSVKNFILDGEMMGWHKGSKCFGSKAMSYDIKKVTENSSFRPCFCAFDILYYNGRTLVGAADAGGMPLSERLKLLDSLFVDIPGVIMHSERRPVRNHSDILEALNKATAEDEEGIVIKEMDSYYMANKRNAGWYKIKPEYTEGATTDLDVVVAGADETDNTRRGKVRSYYVACRDNSGDVDRWCVLGSVAGGLTTEVRDRINAALEAHWSPAKRALPPSCLDFNRIKPDYWILPQHSIVLQIRATELVPSKYYATSHTLRFPRIERVRDDKPVADILTLEEFNKLIVGKANSITKLNTAQINPDQMNEDVRTRKKRTAKVIQVAEQFRKKPREATEAVSAALLGRAVCVLSGDDTSSKDELIKIVESHGGTHVENPGPDTWCCIAGQLTYKVKTYIRSKDKDIISSDWLRSLPPSESQCRLSPAHMFSMARETKMALGRWFDEYGDSYTDLADVDSLKICLRKMDRDEVKLYPTTEEMESLDKELFGETNPFSFLRPCYIHFVELGGITSILAKMYGATVCNIDSPELTHVVVPKTTKMDDIASLNGGMNAPLVSEDWLEACFTDKKLVNVKDFLFQ